VLVEKSSSCIGSLIVVGTGIQMVGQTTLIDRRLMQQADKLLCLVADEATERWLKNLNASVDFFNHLYEAGKPRIQTYQEIVESTLSYVRQGLKVCLVLYGHPGVFCYPGHEAIRRARLEGYSAQMTAGISAEDCLFADLGIDPGANGCQSFEATDFLIYDRRFDPNVPLVLWQIGVIGQRDYVADPVTSGKGLAVLTETLLIYYDPAHEIVVYRAALFPLGQPCVQRMALKELATRPIQTMATLFVPPKSAATRNAKMLARLGIQ